MRDKAKLHYLPSRSVWRLDSPGGRCSFASRNITAEVPGIDESNLDVTVNDDSVTIKGDKKDEISQSKNDKSFHAIERSYGSFERTVSLPCKVQSEKAQAVLKNGVLTVTIPKSHETKTDGRKLTIRRE